MRQLLFDKQKGKRLDGTRYWLQKEQMKENKNTF